MGKRVSYISSKDADFYMINMSYLDYYILRLMLKAQTNEIGISEIKRLYAHKHQTLPSKPLWSQATNRLQTKGILCVWRREQLYLQFASPYVRSQLKNVFSELKQLEVVLEKARDSRQKFEV